MSHFINCIQLTLAKQKGNIFVVRVVYLDRKYHMANENKQTEEDG